MEVQTVLLDILKEFEGNPRKGNIKELKESLLANGQYKPIVVQKSTNAILAGNHLWKAAKELNWEEINVVFVDVDDKQAKKIVATDNRMADLGTYDAELLIDLLEDIDLNGTGYVPQDLDDLLAQLEEQTEPEWAVAGAESHHENVNQTPTLSERADRYAERTVRLLMCEYPNNKYIWVVEQLTALREKFGIDNNAETILKVISEYTGNEIPQ